MYESPENIIKMVDGLNEELTEEMIVNGDYFSLETTGYVYYITFRGIRLWDSDNDEREFYDEKDEYEPLIGFIKKEFWKLTNRMKKIRIRINKCV